MSPQSLAVSALLSWPGVSTPCEELVGVASTPHTQLECSCLVNNCFLSRPEQTLPLGSDLGWKAVSPPSSTASLAPLSPQESHCVPCSHRGHGPLSFSGSTTASGARSQLSTELDSASSPLHGLALSLLHADISLCYLFEMSLSSNITP